jgi:hypothetical protein
VTAPIANARATTDSTQVDSRRADSRRATAAIAVTSLAGLLLEVAYTRVISYKLWYYYTYLVIGLALLGIGSGGILVATVRSLARAATGRIVAVCATWGAVATLVGYWIVARVPIDTLEIWKYGTRGSFVAVAWLFVVCFALFGSFVAIGIIISTILGRARTEIGRLYFADLAAAGVACIIAIPLITRVGPPTVITIAGLMLAALGIAFAARPAARTLRVHVAVATVAVLGLAALTVNNSWLPDIVPDDEKIAVDPGPGVYSDWGPVFRVQTQPYPTGSWVLIHDGTWGAAMHPWDGNVASLTRYDQDPRRIPFEILGGAPASELIIGSAGGNEILASLRFGAQDIEAVELNPVTVSLLRNHFAEETGRLAERPEVDLHQGDGRTYLARSDTDYDLIWYVAPDSYAANNAASSGAFVLSESYLYTTEMIEESLEHLSDRGMMVAQFGELAYDVRPNRTSRYLVTAREALTNLGVEHPERHLLVAIEQSAGFQPTIVVKRTEFTAAELDRFSASFAKLRNTRPVYAAGRHDDGTLPARLAGAPDQATVDALVAGYGDEIDAITDDGPFFWHFNSFRSVVRNLTESLDTNDPESAIGERVLLLLLFIAIVYAAVFLFVPFLFVRRAWAALPAKIPSGIYFACLGLGFMFFEITMIQKLVRFLGYPSYSLTVTLAAILISTGVGALASRRFAGNPHAALRVLLGLLAILTLAYRYGLDSLTDSAQGGALGVRIVVAVLVLTPLGLCLGMFMPLGLGLVAAVRIEGDDAAGAAYTAWSWAVNGFFSVIGSVLTTMLAMEFGFSAVQLAAWFVYALAVAVFARLDRRLTAFAA